MSKVEEFLTANDEAEIIKAIRGAEKQTSGEIRVHIERTFNGDHFERALELFYHLKMDNTKQSNGVLIYVAVEDRNFVIYGDKGINDVVPTQFWESTRDVMQKHFKTANYKQGLIDGILQAGEQLKQHFPWSTTDINELSDEISKS